MNHAFVIIKPLITEKSLAQTGTHRYTFLVDVRATKSQIKQAVETHFGVNVVSVRTVVKPGLTKRTGRRRLPKALSTQKKAVVALKSGQTIKVFETKGA